MNADVEKTITPDEKILAAAAHFFGPLAGIIIWSLQKDKSRFVKYQSLQALSFDFIIAILMGLIFFCGFMVIFAGVLGVVFAGVNSPSLSNSQDPLFFFPFMFPFLTFGCVTPFSLVLIVVRSIAAVSVLNGRNYQYPVLGKWLENFLNS